MTEFPGTVTERDRDYFRRLAVFNAKCDADLRAWWFAKTWDERANIVFERSVEISATYFEEPYPEELYERARRLGLYIN